MSVYNALNDAIYDKLAAGTALTTLLGGTSIYLEMAPDEKDYPFVVFSHPAGGPENINASSLRSQLVQVVGWGTVPLQAGSIDAAVSSLLDRGSVTITGYETIWCVRETDFTVMEILPNNQRVYGSGAQYRIRLTGG